MNRAKPSYLRLPELSGAAWLWVAAGAGIAAGLLIAKASAPIALLALAVGAAGAAIIVVSPELGLLALALTTYLSLSNVLIRFHGAPSIGKLLVPLVLGAVLFRWARGGERPEGWRRPAVLVATYAFACTLSLLAATDTVLALDSLTTLAKNALVFVLVAALVRDGTLLRRLVWALLLAGLFLGAISVHQQLTGNFDFAYWGFGQSPKIFALEGESTTRLGGPVGDPNFYGMMLLAVVPLALDRSLAERRLVPRLAAVSTAVVVTLSIFFTYSRSALVSLVALVALFLVVRRPGWKPVLLAGLVVVLLLPLVPASYNQRLVGLAESVAELSESGSTSEISVRGRLSESLVALEMFFDHPVFGVGAANYPVRYLDYSRQIGLDPRQSRRQPHNLYLEVLSETGLVGFLAFAWVIWATLRGALAARRTLLAAGKTDLAYLTEAALLSFGAYLIASIFLHASHPRYFWLLAGIAIALPRVAAAEIACDDGEPAGSG